MEKIVRVFCPSNKPKIEKFYVYCSFTPDNLLMPLKYSPCDNSNGSDVCKNCAYSLMKQITENTSLIEDSLNNPISV